MHFVTAASEPGRGAILADGALASEVAAGLERLLALIRWLSPPGLSLTSAATLATLERSGPVPAHCAGRPSRASPSPP